MEVIGIFLLLIGIQYSLQASQQQTEKSATACKGASIGQRCLNCFYKATNEELKQKGYNENEQYKLYAKCLFIGYKLISNEGDINRDSVTTYILLYAPSDKIAETVAEKCLKKEDTPLKTAYNMLTCFRQNGLYGDSEKTTDKGEQNDE